MGSANQTVSPQTLEAIKQQPWYFGHITRADCDNILTDKGQDGDFIVRESETNVSCIITGPSVSNKFHILSKLKHFEINRNLFSFSFKKAGDYSVSLKAPGRNKHFRVHVEGTLFCIGQRKFAGLQQLVEHYQRAPIYTSQKVILDQS